MAMTVELPALERAEAAAPRAPATRLRRYARPMLGLLLPVGLALGWEIVVWLGWSNGRLVPPPTKIFATIMELARSGELTRQSARQRALRARRAVGPLYPDRMAARPSPDFDMRLLRCLAAVDSVLCSAEMPSGRRDT